jgi:hypothetical protein
MVEDNPLKYNYYFSVEKIFWIGLLQERKQWVEKKNHT